MKKDRFLRNVLIGTSLLFVALIFSIILMKDNNTIKSSYSDFNKINDYSEVSTQENSIYGVYFYSEKCGACISIKEDTISFANNNKLNMQLYMLDAQTTSGDRNNINLNGNTMSSTPTLLIYENNVLIKFYIGTIEITDFYEAVKSETFSLE
jgi:thiol-disulfide isomerase/thioredoxin